MALLSRLPMTRSIRARSQSPVSGTSAASTVISRPVSAAKSCTILFDKAIKSVGVRSSSS